MSAYDNLGIIRPPKGSRLDILAFITHQNFTRLLQLNPLTLPFRQLIFQTIAWWRSRATPEERVFPENRLDVASRTKILLPQPDQRTDRHTKNVNLRKET